MNKKQIMEEFNNFTSANNIGADYDLAINFAEHIASISRKEALKEAGELLLKMKCGHTARIVERM